MWMKKALNLIKGNKKQKTKRWLDKHQSFLKDYLESAPQRRLDKLGVYLIDTTLFATSITSSLNMLDQRHTEVKRQLPPISPDVLRGSDEAFLFMELVKDISDELDVDMLCHKILRNVSVLTKSDRGSLFLVRGTGDKRYLVPSLFDVTQTTTFEESVASEKPNIRIPLGKGIAGAVAQTKETINIPEAYNDPRFNTEVDIKTGYQTHSVLCMPILNKDGECIAVAEIINKCSGPPHEFTQKDVTVFRRYLMFCGIGLTNAHLFEMSLTEYRRNQILLDLARHIFTEQTNLEKLIEKILKDAKNLSGSQRCSVYLLQNFEESFDGYTDVGFGRRDKVDGRYEREYKIADAVVFSTVFDLETTDDRNVYTINTKPEMSVGVAIARDVIVSKKATHIEQIELQSKYATADFAKDNDVQTCITTVPIFNNKKQIIGVIQHKFAKDSFEEDHEMMIEAFSVFTGLGIHNCIMYEQVSTLMAKQKVALEVLSYHVAAQPDETKSLVQADIQSAQHWNLCSFTMDDIDLDELELAKAGIRMFLESKVLRKFKVPYAVVCKWILSVKKNYRPVIYHNWRHAFNVCQSAFSMLYTGKLVRQFDDLEVFAFLVACLCHDLDHRGTNNAFQVKVESALALLYSTSVMENHHFNQCVMLLHSEGNNIFASLCSTDYRTVLGYVEHYILSTDLMRYFARRDEFKEILKKGDRNFKKPERKQLLSAMMMTGADLSAMYKPWSICFRTSKQVVGEFFHQGDLERQKLGMDPVPMMDRKRRSEMPRLQMNFFDSVCLPLYDSLSQYEPRLRLLYESCSRNRAEWNKLIGADIDIDIDIDPNAPSLSTRTIHPLPKLPR
ncbi:cGMP-specific 3',5'-cyclic phosphodiesterase-like [Gigantopelta aegis]|uniref:cGMP-specific 3',5'-cyclic phosphodiesterase-like n=1 Tax=Gigantopelta aegis TaxID=1735272 RepID=UPI001B887524|nr:cGMP-specific 3',5'-cyclic phosphodiesterase-like [Gigantopelta aegis]